MTNSLLRSAAVFTGALVGGAVGQAALGIGLPLDKLLEGLFADRDAEARRKLKCFTEAMAAELATIGPRDETTRAAACLKIEAALRRNPQSYRRLVELNLDPAAATAELAQHLVFTTRSERTELEQPCRNLIHRYYDKLPRHAHFLNEILPDLWAVTLRRLDDLYELVATMAANDSERRDLQAQVNRLRTDGQMLDRAIITLLQDVGLRIGDASAYPDQLRRAGERYRDLLTEAESPRNLPPEFEAVRQQAATRIREGRLGDADSILLKLRQDMATWRAGHESMLEQGRRDEATILAARAQIAKTRLRYRDAATLFAEAADLTAFDPEASWRRRLGQAESLYAQGDEFGENAVLAEAIATYEQALTLVPRDTCPVDWATTQNKLGNALRVLGERESGTAALERAIQAFETALLECTRERVPLAWAAIQNDLGAAFGTLGERESSTITLERAVQAFELALEERSRESVPLAWAQTQNNLGVALKMVAERQGGTAALERAARACERALEEYTRERAPLDWANTQNTLGNALLIFGRRESGTATLERTVQAYEAALSERTRERVPLLWATTQNNLGVALRNLGRRESGTNNLERAVRAFDAALQERSRERVPLDWAQTQWNLAITFFEIGRRLGDAERLRAALTAVDGALEEFRAGNSEYNIGTAEPLRADIVAALNEATR